MNMDKRQPAVQPGQRFGRLVAIDRHKKHYPSQAIWHWRCSCDCGGEVASVPAGRLTNGQTRSCGCLHKEVCADMLRTHGGTDTLTHRRWASMVSRCCIPSDTSYRRYGAMGVTVCDRWRHSFENFLADMGPCQDGMTLDRLKNERGYEPGNCRWATMQQQGNNKTNNRRVEAFGRTQTVAEWARERGMSYSALISRLHRGMDPLAAMTKPLRGVSRDRGA